MGFREHIERVVNDVPGCVYCSLLGFDGIAIETIDRPEAAAALNAGDATIEYANLVTHIRGAAQNLAAGNVDEVCIESEKMTTILRPLTSEYLIVATLMPHGMVGKGRYLLRILAPILRAELA